jgi:general secretion pathway protein D
MTALQASQSALGKVIIDEETGTVVMIDTNEKLAEMNGILDQVEKNLETKVIQLQYSLAKDVEAQLKPQIDTKGVGSVFADERSNQLVVTAYPGRMEELVKLVKELDKKTRGVLIEGRILQLTLNPKYDFGINWEKTFNKATWQDMHYTNSFPIDTNISTESSLGTVGKLGIASSGCEGELKAVREIESTKVLANPRLMILDRQEAKINIGDRIPYVVTTSTGTGNNISVSEDIRFIDVGIILSVTPVINENGYITMKIRPEISSRTGTLVTPTDNEIPLVNTTYVESTVIVQDGRTVVLGGLIRDEQTELNRGIPYLMDIPWLGQIFKNRNESIRKTEIVILITPKIVTGGEDVMDEPLKLKGLKGTMSGSDPFKLKAFDASGSGELEPVVVDVSLNAGVGVEG